ncbi:HU domain-containing protein [Chitinophaga japonensis]|uniref:CCDC81-like prokaryotic HU domain-containing protein n=1 Tax=Chitinophaga japonensis TaxID=104662 RepID=A0A562T5M4_CHIJA|nr:hypothetical protein [Chitinophaga japonensis]TWI88673.1 hypothetical protein LX66_2759 [Chitinophaga japonensis]
MILRQYIQDVLFRQQVCIVPGIGTFTLQHIPAQYNAVDRSLDPPGQQVTFEEQWTDDGSCLEWISLKENLVPAVARMKLDKYIEALKTSLHSGHPLELPGIGTLQVDALKQIYFEPERLPGKPDTLQLQPVFRYDAPPAQEPAATTPAPPPPPAVPESPAPVEAAAAPEQPVQEPQQAAGEEQSYPTPPWELEEQQQSRFKWWWVVIPIAAALVATAIWWFINNQAPAETSAVNLETAETPAAMDTMSLPQEVTPTDTGHIISATDTLQYYVVFATYTDRAAADKRFRKMKRWGLNVTMYSTRDSANFKLAVPFRSIAADTAANIETVKNNYGGRDSQVYLEF